MIAFNQAPKLKKSQDYVLDSLASGNISGDNKYSRLCQNKLEMDLNVDNILLTTSATSALEMISLLLEIEEGDEIIMPSFTFVSSANPFVLQKAKIIFVDIRLDTLNIDESKIEAAITPKTKAILVVHYNGVSCNIERIATIAKKFNLALIEDAAQALYAKRSNQYLGTFGDLACFSFHESKNFTMGEGGALVINNKKYLKKAKIIWEKGTDRSNFLLGLVDKYTWISKGSSFLPADILAANLLAQLEFANEIIKNRKEAWLLYYQLLRDLSDHFTLAPMNCFEDFNGHGFYLLVKKLEDRDNLIKFLKAKGIIASFHYLPLHQSKAGKKYGYFVGDDTNTLYVSNAIVRLPMYYQLEKKDIIFICQSIKEYFEKG